MLKSKLERYGAVAISIHWLSAILILVLLGTGFQAANAVDSAQRASLLRIHIPIAIIIVLLTVFRLIWWWFFDKKPAHVDNVPHWQKRVAKWVHSALYVLIIVMIISGIGMLVLSGAAPAIFNGPVSALPDFKAYPPQLIHKIGFHLLLILLAFHISVALYHHFIKRDGLLYRMWYGR